MTTALLKDHAAEGFVGEHGPLLDDASRNMRNGVTSEDPCSHTEACKSVQSERAASIQGDELSTQAVTLLKDTLEEEHNGVGDAEEDPGVEQTTW